jgi:hypothetical protein
MKINKRVIDIYYNEIPKLLSRLKRMSKEERTDLYQKWTKELFPKSKQTINLDDLIRGRNKDYIHKFKKAFFIVGNRMFSSNHWGEYLQDKFCEMLNTTSQKYPQKVVVSLGMMGYLTFKTGYCKGKHGYIFKIDLSKMNGLFSDFDDVLIEGVRDDLEEEDDEFDTPEITNATQDDIKSWGLTTQKQTISKIKLSKSYFDESCHRFFNLMRNPLASNFEEYQKLNPYSSKYEYEHLRKERTKQLLHFNGLVNLYHHLDKCYRFKIDNYSGRCHSVLTRLMSEARSYLSLDDKKMKEVDITSCQPTLLGLIALRDNPNIKSEWLEHCISGDFYEWISDVTILRTDYTREGLITKLEYENSYNDEMCGTIDKMNEYIGDDNPYKFYRPLVKAYIMKFLFTKTSIKSMEKDGGSIFKHFQYNLITYLKENEQEIYKIIVWSRDKKNLIPKSKDPTKKSSPLPKMLQEEEVRFMKSVIQNLSNIDYFYTVHDCIGCLESDAEKVKQIMEQTSMDMYGVKLHFKIE